MDKVIVHLKSKKKVQIDIDPTKKGVHAAESLARDAAANGVSQPNDEGNMVHYPAAEVASVEVVKGE